MPSGSKPEVTGGKHGVDSAPAAQEDHRGGSRGDAPKPLAYNNDCPTKDHCLSCQSYYEWTCPYQGATWVCQECYATQICGGCSLAFILRPGAPAQ